MSNNSIMKRNPCQLVRTTCMEFYNQCYHQNAASNINNVDAEIVAGMMDNTIITNNNDLLAGKPSLLVKINNNAIQSLAEQIQSKGTIQPIIWDEENWHYNLMKDINKEQQHPQQQQDPSVLLSTSSLLDNINESNNNNNNNNNTNEITGLVWNYNLRYERTALALVALDAINFCFWPSKNGLEYEHLALCIKSMAHNDHIQQHTLYIENQQQNEQQNEQQKDDAKISDSFIFTANNLSKITENEMKLLFEKHCSTTTTTTTITTQQEQYYHYDIPNMTDRVRMWNHIGIELNNKFNGSIQQLIQSCNNSAPQLVQIYIDTFPECFGGDSVPIPDWNYNDNNNNNITDDSKNNIKNIIDVTVVNNNNTINNDNNNRIYFYKRAQILVGDLNAALQLQLDNIHEITMFADYRVPQILRQYNVLQYSNELSTKIDNYIILQIGSIEEVSIRTATVTAVEMLVDVLNNNDDSNNINNNSKKWNPMITDWYLWQLGERMMNENKLLPHHRVNTIYY